MKDILTFCTSIPSLLLEDSDISIIIIVVYILLLFLPNGTCRKIADTKLGKIIIIIICNIIFQDPL